MNLVLVRFVRLIVWFDSIRFNRIIKNLQKKIAKKLKISLICRTESNRIELISKYALNSRVSLYKNSK
jgi:hypothetical protein